MEGVEAIGIADIAGVTRQKTQLDKAEIEARILLWVFTVEEAQRHIEYNLERTKNAVENDAYKFWLGVKDVFKAVVSGKTDEVEDFMHLLSFINSLEPKEKWIISLLKDVPFQDLKSQLFAVIEDYKKV